MSKFIFEGITVNHRVNKKMKHSYISLNAQGELVLKTPQVNQLYIDKLLQSKSAWIKKQLTKMQKNKPLHCNLEDEVILFGELYSVDSQEAKSLSEKLQKIDTNSKDKVIKAYNAFYKDYSHKYITQKVEYFANIMGYSYKEIKYRKMKSRWGSCNSNKVLTFNTELMKVKKELIDYVVVHELAHLKHMNHSSSFHALVESYLPNSKKFKNELKNIRIATF